MAPVNIEKNIQATIDGVIALHKMFCEHHGVQHQYYLAKQLEDYFSLMVLKARDSLIEMMEEGELKEVLPGVFIRHGVTEKKSFSPNALELAEKYGVLKHFAKISDTTIENLKKSKVLLPEQVEALRKHVITDKSSRLVIELK